MGQRYSEEQFRSDHETAAYSSTPNNNTITASEQPQRPLSFFLSFPRSDDTPLSKQHACMQLPDRLYEGYVDAGTSMAASVAAQMLGKGEIPAGVWAPEECIDINNFFEEMKKRKFKIALKIEKEI